MVVTKMKKELKLPQSLKRVGSIKAYALVFGVQSYNAFAIFLLISNHLRNLAGEF